MDNKKRLKNSDIAAMAMAAAVLCISAYISIPLPGGVPLTLLNFTAMAISLSFPARQPFLIILTWLLLGAAGLPVLNGGGAGVGCLFGPNGGYYWAFLAVSIFAPALRPKKYSKTAYIALALFMAVFIDLVGSVWIMAASGVTPGAALGAGFMPFILPDALKAAAAALLAPKLAKLRRTAAGG